MRRVKGGVFWPCLLTLQCLAARALSVDAGAAIDLTQASFDSFLDGVPPSTTVLMEYYANW